MMPAPLVSTAWLDANLGAEDLVILDGSWHLPSARRNAKAEYEAGHIPGALFFDLDAMSDTGTPLPHMLPTPDIFAQKIGALGVGTADRIVVYDAAGLFSAPRIWWMFRAMGHDAIAVLDGGLPKWNAEGRALETGRTQRASQSFSAKLRPALIRGKSQLRDAAVIDARSAGRFEGTEPEPRPGLRCGHMPGSRNLPIGKLTDPTGALKSPVEIKTLFEEAGLDLSRPIVTSCGSGVTACVLALALEKIGVKDVPVYDGSWAEWGADPLLPVETGPARPQNH